MSTSDGSTAEYTGKDVSYYLVRIESPKRLDTYYAECEDIIEALGMTFAEGCAFKAIWRKCAARTLGIAKAGYKGGLYDAEKAEYYGARMVAAELRAATAKESLTVHPVHPATLDHIDPADVEISEQTANCKGCFAGCRDCCPSLAKIADEKLARMRAASAERFVNECVGFLSEPASAIDDDSERMQAIGQNGEMAAEVYAAVDAMHKWQGVPEWADAPEWAEWLAMDNNGEWYWYERQIRPSKLRGTWEYGSGMSGSIQSAAYSSDDDRPDWRSSLQARPAK